MWTGNPCLRGLPNAPPPLPPEPLGVLPQYLARPRHRARDLVLSRRVASHIELRNGAKRDPRTHRRVLAVLGRDDQHGWHHHLPRLRDVLPCRAAWRPLRPPAVDACGGVGDAMLHRLRAGPERKPRATGHDVGRGRGPARQDLRSHHRRRLDARPLADVGQRRGRLERRGLRGAHGGQEGRRAVPSRLGRVGVGGCRHLERPRRADEHSEGGLCRVSSCLWRWPSH
mmetsp:Transcript_121904/g.339837  ORF Transcript_121904/g.339837 Transcript_121904/m.339837 type:complete len:227 (+) Transcript_121904:121-801(+)